MANRSPNVGTATHEQPVYSAVEYPLAGFGFDSDGNPAVFQADGTPVTVSTLSALTAPIVADAAAPTTGIVFSIPDADALTSGKIISAVSNSSDATARSLVQVKNDHASATGAIPLELVNDSTSSTLKIDHNGVTGAAISVDAETTTGTMIDIACDTVTTGKVIDLSDLAAITTGKVIHIDATGVTQTDGILVHVDTASTALTATGRALLVDHTGASTASGAGIIAEVKSAATDGTTVMRVTASAALAAGVLMDLSGASVTTGTILDLGGLDALTTGTAVNVVSNSSSNGTRSLVKVTNDNTGATGTTCLTIQQDAAANGVLVDMNAVTGAAIAIDADGSDGTAKVIGLLVDVDNAGAGDQVAIDVDMVDETKSYFARFNATTAWTSTKSPESDAEAGWIYIMVGTTPFAIPYYALS